MKTSIGNTLIIVGGLLALAPYVSGFLYEENLTRLLARPGSQNVYLPHGMSSGPYQWACFLLGAAMIGVAVSRSKGESPEPARAAYETVT